MLYAQSFKKSTEVRIYFLLLFLFFHIVVLCESHLQETTSNKLISKEET